MTVGRESKTDSLFDINISTFYDDGGAFDQADAVGFISASGLPLISRSHVASSRWRGSSRIRSVSRALRPNIQIRLRSPGKLAVVARPGDSLYPSVKVDARG